MMKNSAISKFLSIFLCVLAIVAVAAGVMGLDNNSKDAKENSRTLSLLKERTEGYISASKQLQGKPTYSMLKEKLDESQKAHDKAVSQHKTDLAEYTATKGGIISGKEQLQTAYNALTESANQISQFEAMIPQMEAGLAYAKQQGETMAVAQFNQTVFPQNISGTDYNSIDDLKNLASQTETYLQMLNGVKEQAALLDDKDTICSSLNMDYSTLCNTISATSAGLQQLNATVSQLEAGLASAKATGIAMAEEEFYKTINSQLPAEFQGMKIDDMKNMISEAKAQIQFGNDSISLGNWEITKLENELPDKEKKLEDEIEPLEKEALQLEKRWAEANEIKEIEKKLTGYKSLLLNTQNIKNSVDNGEDLISACNNEIDRRTEADIIDYDYRFLSNICLIAAGVLAFLSIFAVFEKIHSKIFLFAPYLFSLLLSVISNVFSVSLKRGLMYSALCLSIFVIVQLIVLLPNLKKHTYT